MGWFIAICGYAFLFSLLGYLLPAAFVFCCFWKRDLKKLYSARWALVTGGSSGIGKSLAKSLAEQGLNVVLVAYPDALLDQTHKELVTAYPQLTFRKVAANLGKPGYLADIAAATADINVQLIFCNAGYMLTGLFESTPLDAQLANVEVNAISSVAIAHVFLERMVAKQLRGAIVFTSSAAASIVSPFSSMYAATKSFLSSFGAALAVEVRHHGIDVLVFHPSPVATRFYDKAHKLDVLEFFKGCAVDPATLPDSIFRALGRTVWHDIGLTAIGFRLMMKAEAAPQPNTAQSLQQRLLRWKDTVKLPKYVWRTLAALILGGQVASRLVRGKVHARNTLEQLKLVGPNSLGVSLLTAGFVGMVFTIQFVREFAKLGLTRSVGGVLGLALVRELTPVVTSIILAGRVGSAFAAELGTMAVSEQTDSLRMLGSDPTDYLISPRVLACMIALPILNVMCFLMGMAASAVLAELVYDVSANVIIDSAVRALTAWDVITSCLKSWVFGTIIAIVSCSWGFTTAGGAKGVGDSTTSAVVISLVLIFVADFFLSFLFFQGQGDALKQLAH
ncbi:hypothetical protein WJX73_002936 [Symbiochloris irregularis]|uniref:Uncharacterized protein n=1 Tax=Symbiochloris irregularis TaxID=706552 RepID=A0AAW1P7E1_9CHLO